MSAGRLRATPISSGRCGRRRPGFSFSGWSPARSAQVQSKSRSALCRWLRSPPAMQTPAGAPSITWSFGHPKPVAQFRGKHGRFHALWSSRHRSQECTATWLGFRKKHSFTGGAASFQLQLPSLHVSLSNQSPLSRCQSHFHAHSPASCLIVGRQCTNHMRWQRRRSEAGIHLLALRGAPTDWSQVSGRGVRWGRAQAQACTCLSVCLYIYICIYTEDLRVPTTTWRRRRRLWKKPWTKWSASRWRPSESTTCCWNSWLKPRRVGRWQT